PDLPACVVVGIDFSRESLWAARAAARLCAPGARIILAHTRSLPLGTSRASSFEVIYTRSVDDALRRFADALIAESIGVIETRLLTGEASTELCALADREGADLIALGAKHLPNFGWFSRGSVRA